MYYIPDGYDLMMEYARRLLRRWWRRPDVRPRIAARVCRVKRWIEDTEDGVEPGGPMSPGWCSALDNPTAWQIHRRADPVRAEPSLDDDRRPRQHVGLAFMAEW